MSDNQPKLHPPEPRIEDAPSSGPPVVPTPEGKNLDSILQDMLDAEDQPTLENDERSLANSAFSSLMPFGNVIPSDCEESSIATSGPLDLSRTNSEKDIMEIDLMDIENQALRPRPKEVYIDPNIPISTTPYGGSYFNRRRASDQSLSSNESNSLSSILDSIGWSSRKQKVHHSRGLKKEKRGLLYKFLSGNKDSAHHERESSQRHLNDDRVSKFRACMLLFSLFMVLYAVDSMAGSGLENEHELQDRLRNHATMRPEGYSAGMGAYQVAVPQGDSRPAHAKEYYAALPKDANGKILKPVVALPTEISRLSDPIAPDPNNDTPLFWVVPKSGAGLIRQIMSTCHSLTLASEYGAVESSNAETELRVINNGNFKYVNVETFSPAGIARAQQLGLVAAKVADVVATPLFLESLILFDDAHHARAFTIIRHPIDRAVSTYEQLKKDNFEPMKDMSLEFYARSQYVENNYLVRYLSGQIEGEVDRENLIVAKAVLKKFLIGLTDNMDKSIERFERYFGFEGGAKCRRNAISKNKMGKTMVKQGTEVWRLLQWQNKLDLELYSYAQELYTKQGVNLL